MKRSWLRFAIPHHPRVFAALAAFDAGKLKFFHTLEPLWERRAFLRTLAPLWNAKWVVHAKRPFAGPEQVLDYVGRYTHRVAISNNRLESMDDANVSFRWKDYRDNNKQKTMTLTGEEFIRRFLLHVVPRGFQRIRYYGFLANSCREQKLARCRELLANQKPPPPSDEPPAPEPTKDYRDQYQRLTGASLRECPACHHGHMIVIGAVKPVPRPSWRRSRSGELDELLAQHSGTGRTFSRTRR